MKEETGNTYSSPNLAWCLFGADAKQGKTAWLVASALGVFPGQTEGIVSSPEHLHVVALDASSLRGLNEFLTKTCGAPDSALAYRVYNCEQDFKASTVTKGAYDRVFYNQMMMLKERLTTKTRAPGIHVVLISSVTSLAEGILRSTLGPAGQAKGAGGDESKYGDFNHQMTELRNSFQYLNAHVWWEGHVYRVPPRNDTEDMAETLQITGRTGVNFPANVTYTCRVRRQFGKKVHGSGADDVYIDSRSNFTFAMQGRAFTEKLDPQERDLTVMFRKLGLDVGGWKK